MIFIDKLIEYFVNWVCYTLTFPITMILESGNLMKELMAIKIPEIYL